MALHRIVLIVTAIIVTLSSATLAWAYTGKEHEKMDLLRRKLQEDVQQMKLDQQKLSQDREQVRQDRMGMMRLHQDMMRDRMDHQMEMGNTSKDKDTASH